MKLTMFIDDERMKKLDVIKKYIEKEFQRNGINMEITYQTILRILIDEVDVNELIR